VSACCCWKRGAGAARMLEAGAIGRLLRGRCCTGVVAVDTQRWRYRGVRERRDGVGVSITWAWRSAEPSDKLPRLRCCGNAAPTAARPCRCARSRSRRIEILPTCRDSSRTATPGPRCSWVAPGAGIEISAGALFYLVAGRQNAGCDWQSVDRAVPGNMAAKGVLLRSGRRIEAVRRSKNTSKCLPGMADNSSTRWWLRGDAVRTNGCVCRDIRSHDVAVFNPSGGADGDGSGS
jgi:hypothetical protein